VGDPTQQVHDWEPGVEPSGLFWTIRLDDDAVEAHPGSGEARLHATAGVRDFHDFFNAVTPGGASVPATVEFDVRWEGRGERSRIRDATFGFVGEFVAGVGSFSRYPVLVVVAALGVILSACYMLWMYQRVFFGEVGHEVRHHVPDLNLREWVCLVPLVALMVWMGTYTQTFLAPVSEADAKILENSPTHISLNAPAGAVLSGGSVRAH